MNEMKRTTIAGIPPLDGAGGLNLASDLRAPIEGGPIEPLRERGGWLWQAVCCVIIAAFLVFLVLS